MKRMPDPYRDKTYLERKQEFEDFYGAGTLQEQIDQAVARMSPDLRAAYEWAEDHARRPDRIVDRHAWIHLELLDRMEKAFRDALDHAAYVKACNKLEKELARLPRNLVNELTALAKEGGWSPWDQSEWIANWRSENVARRETITPKQKKDVWAKSNGVCWYCGKQTNPFDDFRADHFVPVVLGGDSSPDNLVPCCHPCNATKSDSPIEVFRARKGGGLFWFEQREAGS